MSRDVRPDVFNTDKIWQRFIVDFTPKLVKELCLKLIHEWVCTNSFT